MKGLWQKGKALWDEFSTVNAGTHASSIAYFAFLSLIPLLALCISLVLMVGVDEREVAGFFVALVPDALDDTVRDIIGEAFSRSGLAFSLSTIVLLWSASKGIRALRGGLNAAYAVKESGNALSVIAISILAVIVLGLMVAAVMYFIFNDGVMNLVEKIAPGFLQSGFMAVLNPIALLVLGVLVIGVCYALLPAGRRPFLAQLPGAVLASLACAVLSFGFRLYVDHFSDYNVLYGSIGAIALLLMWMFFVSYILIAGGFVNRLLSK